MVIAIYFRELISQKDFMTILTNVPKDLYLKDTIGKSMSQSAQENTMQNKKPRNLPNMQNSANMC